MKSFFVDILLKLMSKETELTFYGSNALAYEWMQIHATLVWQFPVVEAIWEKWWFLETPQMAICSAQWLSAFLYDDDNPFFEPWTPDAGGGPPLVFETLHAKKRAAPVENIDYLRKTMTTDWLENKLEIIVSILSEHSKFSEVKQTYLDLPLRSILFEERVGKLLTLMEHDNPKFVMSWSDI